MKQSVKAFCFAFCLLVSCGLIAQPEKRVLLYANSMSSKDSMNSWIMEGPGALEFKDGWMQMYSPNEKGHQVLWCPQDLPADFMAEWEVRNLHPEAGLCIVFFAAKGIHGEDIFAPSLPKRKGKFKSYIKGKINNYHISYYANGKNEPDRETTNLRKNPGFHLVQKGAAGIPSDTAIHWIQLIKQGGRIFLSVDSRTVIDWQDNGTAWGPGKIGFRQMKWTRFAYRDLKIWARVPKH